MFEIEKKIKLLDFTVCAPSIDDAKQRRRHADGIQEVQHLMLRPLQPVFLITECTQHASSVSEKVVNHAPRPLDGNFRPSLCVVLTDEQLKLIIRSYPVHELFAILLISLPSVILRHRQQPDGG
jgi:hypothetical protein